MVGVETGGLFGLLILIADLWAVVNVLGSRASLVGKVLWVLAILVLPLLGLLVWLVAGPRASHAGP
jgi:Phospholipase_D-nuclease N-terminal